MPIMQALVNICVMNYILVTSELGDVRRKYTEPLVVANHIAELTCLEYAQPGSMFLQQPMEAYGYGATGKKMVYMSTQLWRTGSLPITHFHLVSIVWLQSDTC